MRRYSDKDAEGMRVDESSDSEIEEEEKQRFPSEPASQSTNTNKESLMAQLPDDVKDFFGSVRMGCFPEAESAHTKAQPWRTIWATQRPPTDGKLIVACPKNVVWGSNSGGLGGY